MELLLSAPVAGLRRETSGAFFAPTKARSTCSGDVATESSSITLEDAEEQQHNSRRITLCKQVLLEATTKFNAAQQAETTLMKNMACRNSGALLPLLSMLATEQDTGMMVRALDTLSFLLLDRANREACHELRGLDVLLDILRRATDQHVLLSGLEALCSLCKHDPKDKMALWRHPNKGALLSMLSSRHGSALVVESLRTCRTLCFAVIYPPTTNTTYTDSSAPSTKTSTTTTRSRCGSAMNLEACCNSKQQQRQGCCADGGAPVQQQQSQRGSGSGASAPVVSDSKQTGSSQRHQQAHGSLQLLEPALLTVASELLHPSADSLVLMKALKLLGAASAIVTCAGGGGSGRDGSSSGRAGGLGSGLGGGGSGSGCCGCWHNAVFRIVPLLTHCGDVDVVEASLEVLLNLSEHSTFHNLFFAAGCIPPLLHLLSHKRCGVSQSASCVLSALAEGGLSRDKLCQDTALLAMMRVLQTNHCVVVTIGVLYMLGRLASYRGQVVRSLKGWGAVPLLTRLMATTRDEDAAEGCRQLLQLLGVQALPPPPQQQQALGAASAAPGSGAAAGAAAAASLKLSLQNAHSSILLLGGGPTAPGAPGAIMGLGAVGTGALVRTISAAATVAAEPATTATTGADSPSSPCEDGRSAAAAAAAASRAGARGPSDGCGPGHVATRGTTQHSSFRFYAGSSAAVACGLLGPIAAATAAAAY
ncbi:hypothetical protein PLESTB_001598200 [Pleodorina starrii]|uniref:Uncharacterized protein n=1 Tax=Pleodorina starrii TaxID=330485 RepID=A0A9W6BZD8_9CHLO|nr:hypothetical protein PLESTM_001045200 [Pleodorina starrii]GLC60321.1 hypothetical protein PLESTB_001598200 [Pleodorina starrii]GLC77515.1 hypothetical protein PLESTF_001949700 [Pleodorina starrii]